MVERRLNVCSQIDVTLSIAISSSIWCVLVPKSFTSCSKTDTSSPEYCGGLNSGDDTGGGGGGGNNDGEGGGIDGDNDGGDEDDGGDGK